MSLLDIEKTTSELSKLDYMLYDKFVKYMEEHVPRPLWDHSREPGMPLKYAMMLKCMIWVIYQRGLGM